jgi:hypothetical protein
MGTLLTSLCIAVLNRTTMLLFSKLVTIFQEGGVPVSFEDCMLTVADCPVSIVEKGR